MYTSTISKPTSPIYSSITSSKGWTPKFFPKAVAAVFMWADRPPYSGNSPGTGPCGGSSPISPTQREEPYELPTWKNLLHPNVYPSPSQDPRQPIPHFPHLPEVSHHHGPVIIRFLQDSSNVLEKYLLLNALIGLLN